MNRYFIYNRRETGLGDLLWGLYYIWRYCKAYDMDLVVNWRDSIYLADDTNIYSILFDDCKIDGVNIISDKIENLPEPIYFPIDKINRNNFSVVRFFKRNVFYLKKINANTIISGGGVTHTYSFDENNPETRDEKIKFFLDLMSHCKREMVEVIDNKRKDIFMPGKKYVGIQIRNGNGFAAFYNYFQTIPFVEDKEKFIEKIVKILNFIYRDYEVFLSTDSKDIKDIFIEKYPRAKTLDIWYPEHGKEPQFAKQNGCPDPKNSMIEAFVDMNLLSYCDIIYRAGTFKSCFSLLASHLNGGTKLQNIGAYN